VSKLQGFNPYVSKKKKKKGNGVRREKGNDYILYIIKVVTREKEGTLMSYIARHIAPGDKFGKKEKKRGKEKKGDGICVPQEEREKRGKRCGSDLH